MSDNRIEVLDDTSYNKLSVNDDPAGGKIIIRNDGNVYIENKDINIDELNATLRRIIDIQRDTLSKQNTLIGGDTQ